MPLPPGTRYRVKTTKSGKKVRLAFKGNKVIEVKDDKGTHLLLGKKRTARKLG